ncbi:MAG: glycosyltransferase [Gammaproteobacteria bacterium]|nr:glycosyltransferase [Gammaproteobacteria bacterium]
MNEKFETSVVSSLDARRDQVKRILIYSHDTVGLGNIRRTLVIANHLVEHNPDTTVLIISGSPMLHAFRIRPGIDYLKLPCLDRASEADGYKVRSLSVGFSDLIRLRASLIQQTIMDFDPHLILVDKKPLGVGRELAPAFELLGLRGKKPRCALLLRDILDHPEQTTRVWREHRYYDALEAFYDKVFVLGSEDVFDLATEYQFPQRVADKVEFCGYIGRPRGARGGAFIRNKYGVGDAPLVLVTVGGGEDGAPLLNTYINALESAGDQIRHHSLILTGPDLSPEQHEQLKRRAARLPHCHLGEFSDDSMSKLEAADLVVAMGGYNTVCEVLTLRKPAIIVPRARPVQEQLIRAERMARRGWLEMMHPDDLSPANMLGAVQQQLARPVRVLGDAVSLRGMDALSEGIDRMLSRGRTPGGATVFPLQLQEIAVEAAYISGANSRRL